MEESEVGSLRQELQTLQQQGRDKDRQLQESTAKQQQLLEQKLQA